MEIKLESSRNPREQAILVRATSDAVDYFSRNKGKIEFDEQKMPIIDMVSKHNGELINKAIQDLGLEGEERIQYLVFLSDKLKILLSKPN